MKFEWDPQKDKSNQEKHGISFLQAQCVWSEFHVEVENIAHSLEGEKRNATLGLIQNKVYVVIGTLRGEKLRLISVRRANKNEEKIYYEKIRDFQKHG